MKHNKDRRVEISRQSRREHFKRLNPASRNCGAKKELRSGSRMRLSRCLVKPFADFSWEGDAIVVTRRRGLGSCAPADPDSDVIRTERDSVSVLFLETAPSSERCSRDGSRSRHARRRNLSLCLAWLRLHKATARRVAKAMAARMLGDVTSLQHQITRCGSAPDTRVVNLPVSKMPR
jgi:hypothetical protein